jgi:hypothetical protein
MNPVQHNTKDAKCLSFLELDGSGVWVCWEQPAYFVPNEQIAGVLMEQTVLWSADRHGPIDGDLVGHDGLGHRVA